MKNFFRVFLPCFIATMIGAVGSKSKYVVSIFAIVAIVLLMFNYFLNIKEYHNEGVNMKKILISLALLDGILAIIFAILVDELVKYNLKIAIAILVINCIIYLAAYYDKKRKTNR